MRRNTIEAANWLYRRTNTPNTHKMKTEKNPESFFSSIQFSPIFTLSICNFVRHLPFFLNRTVFFLFRWININSFWARVVFLLFLCFLFYFQFRCELKCRRYHKHYASQLNWRTALVCHEYMVVFGVGVVVETTHTHRTMCSFISPQLVQFVFEIPSHCVTVCMYVAVRFLI